MGTSPIISGVVDACTNTKKAPSISTWCLPAAHEATGLTRSMVFKKALLKILMKLCAMRSLTITDSWRHGMSPEGLTRALVPWIYIYIPWGSKVYPEMTSLFACISDLTLFMCMDPQGYIYNPWKMSKKHWDILRYYWMNSSSHPLWQ